MKIIIALIFYSYVASKSVLSEKEKKCHSKHVIMKGLNRPYQLAMYTHGHKIFYSYNVGKDNEDTFGIGYVKINDTKPTEIPEVKNGFAIAIDEHNKIAYFGGSDGIYTDNLNKSDGIKHVVKDHNIWDMFFHKHLYFITYPSMRLHKYHEEHKNDTLQEHIPENIYQFAIDGENDVYITTVDGLHMIKANETERISIDGPKQYRAVEVNRAGVAHFCANHSIYIVNKSEHKLVEIAAIRNVFGLTFDSDDHIIYSDPHEIVKLMPHKCEEKEEEKKEKKNEGKNEEKKKP